jgi:hypothetical protein
MSLIEFDIFFQVRFTKNRIICMRCRQLNGLLNWPAMKIQIRFLNSKRAIARSVASKYNNNNKNKKLKQ